MLETSIVSETSSIGAGKVLDKKAHFKAGVIDFTAGSLGEFLNNLDFISDFIIDFLFSRRFLSFQVE